MWQAFKQLLVPLAKERNHYHTQGTKCVVQTPCSLHSGLFSADHSRTRLLEDIASGIVHCNKISYPGSLAGFSPGCCVVVEQRTTFGGCKNLSPVRYVSCSIMNLLNGQSTCENKKTENQVLTKATIASTSAVIGACFTCD